MGNSRKPDRLALVTGGSSGIGAHLVRAFSTPSYVFQRRELVRCIRDGAPVVTSVDNGVIGVRASDAICAAAGLPLRGS